MTTTEFNEFVKTTYKSGYIKGLYDAKMNNFFKSGKVDDYRRQLINHKSYIGSIHTFDSASVFLVRCCDKFQYITWQNPNEEVGIFFISFLSNIFTEPTHFSVQVTEAQSNYGIYVIVERFELEMVRLFNYHYNVYSWKPTHFYPLDVMVGLLSCVDSKDYLTCSGMKREPFNRYNNPCTVICEIGYELHIACQSVCSKKRNPWSLLKLCGFIVNSYFSIYRDDVKRIPLPMHNYLKSLKEKTCYNNDDSDVSDASSVGEYSDSEWE